jgi:transposase
LLLRHHPVYTGRQAWAGAHHSGLVHQGHPHLLHRATRLAFDVDYEIVMVALGRRDRLDRAIAARGADSEYTALVHRLGCQHGISTPIEFRLSVEIGDWHRFTGDSIGSFVGLIPRFSTLFRR